VKPYPLGDDLREPALRVTMSRAPRLVSGTFLLGDYLGRRRKQIIKA